jgi:hypothetical protein
MSIFELERRLIKSPPEVWEELSSATRLGNWLGEVRVSAVDPPHRLEWDTPGASGVIMLESLGWGTRVRVQAETGRAPAWERLQLRYALERSLRELLDDLSKSSLRRGGDPRRTGARPNRASRSRSLVQPRRGEDDASERPGRISG